MKIDSPEERKAWLPYVHAVISLCSIGREVGYFVMNPKMQYKMWGRMRGFLKQQEIDNKELLAANIEWFLETGRREEFYRDSCYLSALSSTERSRYIDSQEDEQRKRQLMVVNRYLRGLFTGGIGAYDYSWTMLNCFAGREVGYLSDSEMWAYISRLIYLIKADFSDWDTYIASYAAGHQYLMQDQPYSFVSKNRKMIMQMMSSPLNPMLHFKP
ncbi:DUF1266 domain-containing protein [Paenibacillus ihumii]|uniref:DUF1266 domain-containing protein n=1 Tax=Paenibacillus ihumii TaxID=687436 RepID=UPI0006D7D3A6|nr:DUF1266 domain-containing protein [Paenibacillus ihumii]